MKADLDNYTLACTETFTEEEKKQYKEAIDKLYELGIDIYEYDGRNWNVYYTDGIHNFRVDSLQAIRLILDQHKEIPDDLRTRLEYYKKVREQQDKKDNQ